MSLYNTMNGVNHATWWILPMLGHHPDWYPRFRDCFISENSESILIYTRVGTPNKEMHPEELAMIRNHPNYLGEYDDSYDCTYGYFIFSVPEKWKNDFDKIVKGNLSTISKDYFEEIIRVYPKLENELRKTFNIQKTESNG